MLDGSGVAVLDGGGGAVLVGVAVLDGGAVLVFIVVAAAKTADNGNRSLARAMLIVDVLEAAQSHGASRATEPMSQRHVSHAALSIRTVSSAGRAF